MSKISPAGYENRELSCTLYKYRFPLVNITNTTFTITRFAFDGSNIRSQYFRRTASVLQAGEFFWRIKRLEGVNSLFEVPVQTDQRRIGSRLHLSYSMYTSSGRNHRVQSFGKY